MKYKRLYFIRHTFATYMIAEGADIITVANYLGHANPSMTLDIYADIDPEAKMRAVKHIENAFDDADSVLRRDIRKRQVAIEESKQTSNAQEAANISAGSIPFTIEELEAMLATLKAAS